MLCAVEPRAAASRHVAAPPREEATGEAPAEAKIGNTPGPCFGRRL